MTGWNSNWKLESLTKSFQASKTLPKKNWTKAWALDTRKSSFELSHDGRDETELCPALFYERLLHFSFCKFLIFDNLAKIQCFWKCLDIFSQPKTSLCSKLQSAETIVEWGTYAYLAWDISISKLLQTSRGISSTWDGLVSHSCLLVMLRICYLPRPPSSRRQCSSSALWRSGPKLSFVTRPGILSQWCRLQRNIWWGLGVEYRVGGGHTRTHGMGRHGWDTTRNGGDTITSSHTYCTQDHTMRCTREELRPNKFNWNAISNRDRRWHLSIYKWESGDCICRATFSYQG